MSKKADTSKVLEKKRVKRPGVHSKKSSKLKSSKNYKKLYAGQGRSR